MAPDAPDPSPFHDRRRIAGAGGRPIASAGRTAAMLALAGGIALVRYGTAAAHGETVESRPAPGEIVFPAPSTVTVRYTAPLGPASTISVVDEAFAEVTEGPTRVDAADPTSMTADLLRDLPVGAYTVAWTALDADDGHTTSGSYTFRIGERSSAGRTSGAGGQTMFVLAFVVLAVLGAASVARRRARPTPGALGVFWAAVLAAGVVAGCSPQPADEHAARTADTSKDGAAGSVQDTSKLSSTDQSSASDTSSSSDTDDPAPASTGAAPDDPNGIPIQISIAASDMAVGEERFAFAILDVNNALLPDVAATATFFRLEGESAEDAGTAPAAYYASSLPGAGTYVAWTRFDRAGPWGVQISGTLPDGRAVAPNRVRFEVASRPRSPAVGDKAPPTANRTLATQPDIAALTSDPLPDRSLYAMTVDEAVASGKPTVVVFATPGYCASRICTPVIDEVKAMAGAWSDRVNFIHLEVYKSFSPLVLADEMDAWGLETEPWTFVLTRDGRVAARLEGNATRAELEPLLERVTGGG